MSRHERTVLSPYLLLVMTPLFWAGNFVLARGVHMDVPPVGLAFWRWSVALLLILPFVWRHWVRDWPHIKANWPILLLLGILSVANFNTFIYLGVQTVQAANGILLQSACPILIILFSWLFYRDRVTAVQVIGMLASLIGVIVIITQGHPMALANLDFIDKGNFWILAAVTSWALYSALLRKRPLEIGAFGFFGVTVVIGVTALFPFYLYETLSGHPMPVSSVAVGSVAYMALFASVLAYLFWNRAVAELGANRCGHFIHLVPAFGICLSVLFLGEQLQLFHGVGLLLIFIGIYLATVLGRSRAAKHSAEVSR